VATPDFGSQIIQGLQNFPNNPQVAVDQHLIPVAQGGDARAMGLAAYYLGQQGRWPEAAEWAEKADDAGCIYIAFWVGHQLIGQPDVALKARGANLLARAMAFPTSVDPFGFAQQLVQNGAPAEALSVLDAAIGQPMPWRERLKSATEEAQVQLESIRQSAAGARAEQDRVSTRFAAMEEAAKAELDSIKRLGIEVGDIAHDTAADYLKRGYEAEAKSVQTRADRLTIVSVVLAIAIAFAAIYIGTHLPAEDTLSEALEKAAFSIPLLALNAYLGSLASHYREEALRWRHIKLQIQTANPYLGALDEAQRKETLALLATRFFPGQPMPLPDKAAEPSDVSAALAGMFQPAQAMPKVTVEQAKVPDAAS
jgi:hypothetical protein